MNNTILCIETGDFWEIVFRDIINYDGVSVMTNDIRWNEIKNMFVRKICLLHHSRTLNSKFDFPLKWVWNKYDSLRMIAINRNVDRIIFTDTAIKQYSKSDLLFFRKKNIKLYLIILNPISSYKETQRAMDYYMQNLFEETFSVDENDAIKYGFRYRTYFYSKKFLDKKAINWKLSFVGNSKGRVQIINEIATKLSKIKTIFYINGVNENDKCSIPNVVYNSYLGYSDVLELVNESECVLEVLQKGQCGFTFRTYEAICYNKKLITNNKGIMKQDFFNPDYIMVYDSIDDAPFDKFMNNGITPNYDVSNKFSPINLLKEIKEIEKDKARSE